MLIVAINTGSLVSCWHFTNKMLQHKFCNYHKVVLIFLAERYPPHTIAFNYTERFSVSAFAHLAHIAYLVACVTLYWFPNFLFHSLLVPKISKLQYHALKGVGLLEEPINPLLITQAIVACYMLYVA